MPAVHIKTNVAYTEEQKTKVLKEITRVMVDVAHKNEEAVMATLRWGADAFRLTGLTARAEAGDLAGQQTLAACGFCRAQDGSASAEGPVLYRYRVG